MSFRLAASIVPNAGVTRAQPRRIAVHDEELAPVRVRPGVRHRQDAATVLQRRVHLVREAVPGPPLPLAARVAALQHLQALADRQPVALRVVEVLLPDQAEEVLHRTRCSALSRVTWRSPIDVFRLTFDVPDALVLPSAGGFTFFSPPRRPSCTCTRPRPATRPPASAPPRARSGCSSACCPARQPTAARSVRPPGSSPLFPTTTKTPTTTTTTAAIAVDRDPQVPPLPPLLSDPLGLPYSLPRRQLLLMGLLGHAEPSSPKCLQGTYSENLRTVC